MSNLPKVETALAICLKHETLNEETKSLLLVLEFLQDNKDMGLDQLKLWLENELVKTDSSFKTTFGELEINELLDTKLRLTGMLNCLNNHFEEKYVNVEIKEIR